MKNLSFLHKLALKSFAFRLKSVRDILGNGNFTNTNGFLLFNSDELVRVILHLKSFVALPIRQYFFLKKIKGKSIILEIINLYSASFCNLLLLTYLPFDESYDDKLIVGSHSGIFESFSIASHYKRVKFLFSSFGVSYQVFFFKRLERFTVKSIVWFIHNFPFDKKFLNLYLSGLLFKIQPFYFESVSPFFNYNSFNTFLLSYTIKSLLCL